ncbi:MAG: dTDP-4-dehydrorhamnose reductase [Planctomycetes bacterium]|nr:dTDP-4-dehydrorhamnose reductase [Planctomycetota bacterium]
MLGHRVVEELGLDHEVLARARAPEGKTAGLDLHDRNAVRAALETASPEVVVNCAAYTAVDDCESNREAAYLTNAVAVENLAWACREVGASIFHISTDYVFDGEKGEAYDEWDEPNPRSVYGRSKLAGEQAVLRSGARFWIGRVQWLYGEGGRNFADTILGASRQKPMLRVVDDQMGCPTYTGDVARQIALLIESGRHGLYHMSARGQTSWFGFTKALLAAEGREDYHVEPCTTAEFPRPAPRPRNSVLRNLALELSIGDDMPEWERGLEQFMARRKAKV